ncbi:hypothetical protein [Lactiplantibacillus plantarum]|uniref:hypothetical protein n=1 Tax=Lactiplantibacillus plantarum TaxID=1590 RepID=UPI003F538057
MEEIISFEFSNGSKLLDSNVYEYKVGKEGTIKIDFPDSNVYEYKVGKEGTIKIDFPDSNGFVAVHKNNTETAYIKAPYMKFCTGRHA